MPKVEHTCEACGKTFLAWAYAHRRYCSQDCYPRPGRKGADMRGPNNPKWKGGRMTERGRVLIYAPDHPNAKRGYIYEYRLVVSQMLGRPLREDEIVHHKDGDVTNNAPENLEVKTQADHLSDHAKQWHAEGKISAYKGPRDEKGRYL